MTDVLIVGAGPAGLTAAIYAARAGVSVLVFEKNMYGGQVSLTSEVDNFPTQMGIQGADFAGNLYEHATSQGAEVRFEEVQAVELDGPVKRVTTSQRIYEGRSVIIAGGAFRRKLGCPGEEEFAGRGVSYCATCDAAFFRGKTVAIVGGGDTALGDALFLSNNCEKVYLIHRRDSFRGQKAKQDAIYTRDNIETILPAKVTAIEGEDTVKRCILETATGTRVLDVDGVFVAVGLAPETELFGGLLPLTPNGYIDAGEDCTTPLPGVFVAGDLRQKPLRQIVTAAADGAVAAVSAAEYCNALDENLEELGVKPGPLGPGE
ncbi:FAD-dependent oxidoreductase [Clostridia bacterium OttesenSCG-928-O13]|nr:FAD-dependent oxidoreductase [Clostridia bacterium OttesenSCG-928-O13]